MNQTPATEARTEEAFSEWFEESSQPVFLDYDGIARRWGVPRTVVVRLAREGAFQGHRFGKFVRFSLADVETYEASVRRSNGADL